MWSTLSTPMIEASRSTFEQRFPERLHQPLWRNYGLFFFTTLLQFIYVFCFFVCLFYVQLSWGPNAAFQPGLWTWTWSFQTLDSSLFHSPWCVWDHLPVMWPSFRQTTSHLPPELSGSRTSSWFAQWLQGDEVVELRFNPQTISPPKLWWQWSFCWNRMIGFLQTWF